MPSVKRSANLFGTRSAEISPTNSARRVTSRDDGQTLRDASIPWGGDA